MRSMEDANFVEQENSDAAAFALADFGSKFLKKSFNVTPMKICTDRVSEDEFKRALMLSLHFGWYYK